MCYSSHWVAMKLFKFIFFMIFMKLSCGHEHKNSEMATILHRPIRGLSFPEASSMGLFFALAVPLPDPQKSVSVSYFFEASYNLPPNTTINEPWGETKRKKRTIDRTTIYQTLENKFENWHRRVYINDLLEFVVQTHRRYTYSRSQMSHTLLLPNPESFGFSGRACVLRSICETSKYNLNDNGVVGDIFNVIFKPSTSRPENLPQDVIVAEVVGQSGDCTKYHQNCPAGLFDLIGVLV